MSRPWCRSEIDHYICPLALVIVGFVKKDQKGKIGRNPLSALNSLGSWCKEKSNLIIAYL